MINGQYVEKLGLGISRDLFNKQILDEFLSGIDQPLGEDDRIIWPDNTAFLNIE